MLWTDLGRNKKKTRINPKMATIMKYNDNNNNNSGQKTYNLNEI